MAGNVDVTEWRVRLRRQMNHPEGFVLAWEAGIYLGDELKGYEYGTTRDDALTKARSTAERLKQGEPQAEWVTL